MKIDLAKYVGEFLAFKATQKTAPNTLSAYKRNLNHFLTYLNQNSLAKTPPTRQILEDYIASLGKSQFSTASINQYVSCLKKFFGYLSETHGLSNPTTTIHRKPGTAPAPPIQSSYVINLMQLLDQNGNLRDCAMFYLIINLGLSTGTLSNLKRRDVHVTDDTLYIQTPHGRLSVQRNLTSEKLFTYVKDYIEYRRLVKTNSDAFFLSTKGTPITRDNIKQFFTKFRKRANIGKLNTQNLRHTPYNLIPPPQDPSQDTRAAKKQDTSHSVNHPNRQSAFLRWKELKVLQNISISIFNEPGILLPHTCVVISGPTGMGKTTLIQKFCDQEPSLKHYLFAATPFTMFNLQDIIDHLRSQQQLPQTLADKLIKLHRIYQNSNNLKEVAPDTNEANLSHFALLSEIFLELTYLNLSLFVFENLQNFSKTATAFLIYLVKLVRKRNIKVLFILTIDDEIEHAGLLNHITSELEDMGTSPHKILLKPLDRKQIQTLVRQTSHIPQAHATAIVDYLTTIKDTSPSSLRDIITFLAAQSFRLDQPPPLHPEQILLNQLTPLSKAAKRLVEFIAVYGAPISVKTLEAINHIYPLETPLKELLRQAIVKETAPGLYYFRNHIHQRIIYFNIQENIRLGNHRLIAQHYLQMGRHDSESCHAIAHHLYFCGDMKEAVIHLDKLAQMYHTNLQFEQSLEILQKIKTIFSENPELATSLNLAFRIGEIEIKLGNLESASEYLEFSLKDVKDDAEKPFIHNLIGILNVRLGRFDRAIQNFDHAIASKANLTSIRKKTKQPSLTEIHLNKVAALNHFKRHNQAQKVLSQIQLTSPSLKIKCRYAYESGLTHFYLNHSKLAEKSLDQSIALAQKSGNKRMLSNGLTALGLLKYSLHQYDQARTLFQQATAIANRLNNHSLKITLRKNIATVYHHSNDFIAAVRNYTQALEEANLCGYKLEENYILFNLAILYFKFGITNIAWEYLGRSQKLTDRLKISLLEASNTHLEAELLQWTGNHQEAIKYYKKAISLYKKLESRDNFIEAYIAYCQSLYALKMHTQLGQARDFINQFLANDKDKHIPREIEFRLFEVRSNLVNTKSEYGKIQKRLHSFKKINMPELDWQINRLNGLLAYKVGNIRKANHLYTKAINHLTQIAAKQPEKIGNSFLFNTFRKNVFEEYRLVQNRPSPPDPAIDINAKLKQLTETFNRRHNLKDLLKCLRQILSADLCALILTKKTHHEVTDYVSQVPITFPIERLVSWVLINRVYEVKNTVYTSVLTNEQSLIQNTAIQLKNVVCTPIVKDSACTAILYCSRDFEHNFSEPEKRLITTINLFLNVLIDNHYLKHQTESKSNRSSSYPIEISHPARTGNLPGIIGKSASIQKVITIIRKIAHTDLPVLIQGESGTGKELLTSEVGSPRNG